MEIALKRWKLLAQAQLEGLEGEDPIPEVYQYKGDVSHKCDAFVLRTEITNDLVRQIQNPRGCSGILLYGRRRLGKTTVIRNLEAFVPEGVKCTYISMQNAEAFTSLDSLLALIIRTISKVIDGVDYPSEELSLRDFQTTLAQINQKLAGEGKRLIIAVDEIEILDDKFQQGLFSTDVLAVIREGIHSYPEVVWLFVSSHLMAELSHRAWNRYFIELHTTRVSPFHRDETHKLLCEPLASKEPSARGGWLKVEPARWGGEVGIDRIHRESGGWPSIIQLIAQVVARMLKENGHDHADETLLDQALEKSVEQGNNLFEGVMYRERSSDEEWHYLRQFARETELDPSPVPGVMDSLWRRELIDRGTRGYILRVPIVSRWLRMWYPS